MKYIDAHCHLPLSSPMPTDLGGRICSATKESEWCEYVCDIDGVNLACVGIHPWYVSDIDFGWETRLCDLLVKCPHLMVGEVGLDKYHDNISDQEKILTIQMKIACELKRPMQLHCVGAWDKLLHILKTHKRNLPPVIFAHAYSGPSEIIEKLANEYNMYFSYCIENTDNLNVCNRVVATPLDRLLTESDTHDCALQMPRIINTVQTLAELRGLTQDKITEQVLINFKRMIQNVDPA